MLEFMLGLQPSTIFAIGTVAVAAFLGLWQWYDKRARRADADATDRLFSKRQDLRRSIGIVMMLLLAGAIFFVDSAGTSRRAQAVYLVFLAALIIGLLALALFDALSTLRYARRQRRELAQEHAKLMLEVIRRTGSSDSRRGSEKKRELPET